MLMIQFRRPGRVAGLLAVAFLAATSVAARAQTVTTLASFTDGAPGALSGVVQDASGNLYGVTGPGVVNTYGAVYEISGGTMSLIYAFQGGADGDTPVGDLVMDANGNLYGATQGGSTGLGTIFMLTPPANPGDPWTNTTLYQFSGPDGAFPSSGPILNIHGALLGTTTMGGNTYVDSSNMGLGTAYILRAPTAGNPSWQFTSLYSFQGGTDGALPAAPLTLGTAGQYYGTTTSGGTANLGTVYRLRIFGRRQTGLENVIYSFQGAPNDGASPLSGVTLDSQGDLFGVTQYGGLNGSGTVYELAATLTGLRHRRVVYTENVLYSFVGNGDGNYPLGGLLLQPDGSLYGTTYGGGAYDYGEVFSLTPNNDGTGTYTQNVVVSFSPDDNNGVGPQGGLVNTPGGLVTTTSAAGANGYGGVVQISP